MIATEGKKTEGKIKLNLGCGHRLMDGYINIDMPNNYIDKLKNKYDKPDFEADITNLPYEDNYADEIIAIHVIEHFYYWEVEDVLKEWLRVLKPGGLLVLELPDLLKILYHFNKALSDLEKVKLPLAKTLWALYGNDKYKDPNMVHKWAWFDVSLKDTLKKVGFIQTETKEPKYHFKARDMRIEAIKPKGGI
jgi:predicted SAM-dependent methyltransferase